MLIKRGAAEMLVCGLKVCACTRLGISDRDIIAVRGERYMPLIHKGRGVFSLTLRMLNCGFPDSRRVLLPDDIGRDARMEARS